ncbi:MAG: PhnD/SsuA/transferrin family substrate-binding protein [Ramlibacter sp.]|nr:PhnD/SsuA/transferrin family substrate-binding protein [Ramlibacter sp.]
MTDRSKLAVFSSSLRTILVAAVLTGAHASHAQMTAMVAVDPSSPKDALGSAYVDLSVSLAKATGQDVRVDRNTNFADVLRSTRTGEYDIYVVPPHVAASALSHGYISLAATDKVETFVLVAKPGVASVKQLKGTKLYLAQQDSIYSYMAKGLLNEAGVSIHEAGDVQYKNTSGAGLIAVSLGVAHATVVRKAEYQEWARNQSTKLVVLLESKQVPAGLTILVKKTATDSQRERLSKWAVGSNPAQSGLGKLRLTTPQDSAGYEYLGGLGHFTPGQLAGVTRISAKEAAELIGQGAQMVDVRSEKEFKAKHIPGAASVPYLEKSVKDISFDAKVDDFSALDKLDKNKPTVFGCNGAECWKSYKASKVATERGFKKVYWLRGGLPEWEARGLPLAAD